MIAYPTPPGFGEAAIQPEGALWSAAMGNWLLPYDLVRADGDPDAAVLSFLRTTYEAAANLGGWDRALDCEPGKPRRPRPV